MQNSEFRMQTLRRSRFLYVVALSFLLLASSGVSAQFGHPLKGQWSGQWGPADNQQRLLLDLHWDGKTITGVINPGSEDAATVKGVTIDYADPSAWKVKLQAEGKNASGKPITIAVDGVLENIGAYSRLFHGTWSQGGQKGEFTVTRN
jgi:hypothetical protein